MIEIAIWYMVLIVIDPISSESALLSQVFYSHEKCNAHSLLVKKKFDFKAKPKCLTTKIKVRGKEYHL